MNIKNLKRPNGGGGGGRGCGGSQKTRLFTIFFFLHPSLHSDGRKVVVKYK